MFKKIFEYLGLICFYLILMFFTDRHYWLLPLMLLVVLVYSFKKPFDKILKFVLPFLALIFLAGLIEGFSKAIVHIGGVSFVALLGWFSNKIKLFSYIVLGTLVISVFTYYVLPNTLFYFSNKEAYVNNAYSFPVLYDRNQEDVVFDKNKMYVLDFWHTRCGPCYKKFPEFERVSEMYKNDSSIEFYAVNIENKSHSFEQTLEIIDRLDYSFKYLFALDKSDEVAKELNIRTYPTLLIIKEGKVVYHGSYVSEKNVFIHQSLDKEIEGFRKSDNR